VLELDDDFVVVVVVETAVVLIVVDLLKSSSVSHICEPSSTTWSSSKHIKSLGCNRFRYLFALKLGEAHRQLSPAGSLSLFTFELTVEDAADVTVV
jgi:hypothetical protein